MTKETFTSFTTEELFKAVSVPLTYNTNHEDTAVHEIDNAHKSQCRGTHLKPQKSDLTTFLGPSVACFCKKPANRYYTMEYGPILECASYNRSTPHYNPRYVCGFHVHERSWKKLHQQLQEGHSICSRFMELRACSLYNFTYCAMFKVKNDYKIAPVSFPNCFCGKPVKMVHEEEKKLSQEVGYLKNIKRQPLLVITNFICSNRNVQGAPKCNYLNSADKSVFQKPKYQLHKEVDHDTYIEQRNVIRSNIRCSLERLSSN